MENWTNWLRYLKKKILRLILQVWDTYHDAWILQGIRQYIFLLFHLEELLKLYVNLFYRFWVTLFLEIFEQKKSQISELAFRHLGFWRICMWHHEQGHARILSIEQLVIMSPKSYTSVTIWNKKLSDDFSNKTYCYLDVVLYG
jgi:hypothetical protein